MRMPTTRVPGYSLIKNVLVCRMHTWYHWGLGRTEVYKSILVGRLFRCNARRRTETELLEKARLWYEVWSLKSHW
eukprot:3858467-Rhodomonas_salina.2